MDSELRSKYHGKKWQLISSISWFVTLSALSSSPPSLTVHSPCCITRSAILHKLLIALTTRYNRWDYSLIGPIYLEWSTTQQYHFFIVALFITSYKLVVRVVVVCKQFHFSKRSREIVIFLLVTFLSSSNPIWQVYHRFGVAKGNWSFTFFLTWYIHKQKGQCIQNYLRIGNPHL